jgi:hypothetical protein
MCNGHADEGSCRSYGSLALISRNALDYKHGAPNRACEHSHKIKHRNPSGIGQRDALPLRYSV